MKHNDIKNDLNLNLCYEKKNFWENTSPEIRKKTLEFAENYKKFLDICKTERLAVKQIRKILNDNDFREKKGNTAKKFNKIYKINRNKNIAIARLGKKDIIDGFNMVVSHLDSPRVDLKQVPLYEDSTTKLALLHTHYYGSIKKYQWTAIPLSLYGIIIKENGEKIYISIGDAENEPVFSFTDLLPHLSKEQYKKKIGEAIDAEKLKLLFGSTPYLDNTPKDVKDKVKFNCLKILNNKYGITEEDFISAELEIVPALKTRDVGIDRSMIGAYGQDDKVCSYTSLQAILDIENPEYTSIVLMTDKEEIGSVGNTGVQSEFFLDFISEIIDRSGYDSSKYLRKTLLRSKVLSADVNAGINPTFLDVQEKQNASKLGFGVCLTKYTGVRGKSNSNDSNAEFVAKIRNIFNENNVIWQTGELGKVDIGGGGTVAKFIANLGADVIDCGPPVLSMHSPFEITNKGDVYSAYNAYKVFLMIKRSNW